MNEIVYAGKHAITYSVSRHAHSSIELIYCTSGRGQIILDRKSLSYSSGNIAVIPPMLPHINISDEGFTNIFINIEDFSSAVAEPFIMNGDDNGFIENAFKAAYYFYSGNDSRRKDFLSLYGNLVAAFVSTDSSSDSINSTVKLIEKNILENYQDPAFDLSSFLRTLPFSYDYLTKLFKKNFGYTPHKYLTARRLQSAAAELEQSEFKDISEIARGSGFNDPLYFSRLFKKYYGISPKAFKNTQDIHSTDAESMKIYLNE